MIWVTGCNGMLGKQVCRDLSEQKIEFLSTGSEVDITDFEQLKAFASLKRIDFIVNCASYTAVDKAESDEQSAFDVNSKGSENLARIAKECGATLIHISTDYVFDGKGVSDSEGKMIPYTEEMPVNPCGVYGSSKAEGEKLIISHLEKFYILRTAWLYGEYGKNFVYTMIKAMNSRDSLKVVDDQYGSPTFTRDLSRIIVQIITSKKTVPYGIYHCTCCGKASWWDFAVEIQKHSAAAGLLNECGRNCVINHCSTAEYPTSAKRPALSVLDNSKIQKALCIQLPHWNASLREFVNTVLPDNSYLS